MGRFLQIPPRRPDGGGGRQVQTRALNTPREAPPFDLDDGPEVEDAEFHPDLKRLSKRDRADPQATEQVSKFRKELTRLRELVGADGESDDFRSDVSTKVMLRAMLATTLELIPTAAEKYASEKNESAAYAYNALLNQAKTLSSEIRGLDTLEEQADHIVERILMPVLVQFTQNLLNGIQLTKSTFSNYDLSPTDVRKLKQDIDNFARAHVQFMNESSKALSLSTRSYLLGEDRPAATKPRRGKGG